MQHIRYRVRLGLSGGFQRTLLVVIVACLSPAVLGDERFADFLQGLRDRKYFDTALEYLSDLETRSDLPKDFAAALDLERGVTYRSIARVSRPDDAEQALSNAEQALTRFLASNTRHPRAAFANSELGQLMFERARSVLWNSEAPSSASKKKELQQEARSLIDRARSIFQRAHDQYKQQYDQFPKFIDRDENPRDFEARLNVDVKYLRAWFNLVRCTYERGLTFDRTTPERRSAMSKASKLFDEIHSLRRDNSLGLQSRLMVGKCYQEQGDLEKALGIYQEMLSQTSERTTIIFLRSLALQYRLICLNHDKYKDYQVVMQEADQWLKARTHRNLIYTETGLGILWEKAVAQERYGNDRTLDEKKRPAVLRQAAADAKQVARFPGPYRQAAIALGVRVSTALGTDNAAPKDFATAFERGRALVLQLKDLERKKSAAGSDTAEKQAQQAIDLHLNEVGRMFELALSLRETDSDVEAVAQARNLLSFVYMRQRKSFDAVILARYCMTYDRENDPDSALSATEIAINAAVQAFNDAQGDAGFELALLQEICQQIVDDYPQSSKGSEARMRLGQVFRDLKQPLQAAEQYLTVPSDYSNYGSARIQAGQSYWLAWVNAMSGREAGTMPEHDSATIDQWKADAQQYLQEGIERARQKVGRNNKPTPEIVAAEVSLATALNMDGNFAESVARLTSGDRYSVVSIIQVPTDEERPTRGITSSAFAGQTYRLLLRAYVGEQQIGRALAMMQKLEDVGGQDVTTIYTQLGRELQEELTRLKASGNRARLQQVRTSFEEFLGEVNKQRDKTDFNSLLWIGETYYGLGNGISDDPSAAAGYFRKASEAYQDILDGNLAKGTAVQAVKLRLVRCLRSQKNFPGAISLAKSVLERNPMQLDVQFEAAYTLSDWGADKRQAKPEKLLDAIRGADGIWGWAGIVSRLQARQNTAEWKTLKDRYLEARYEYTHSRYRYARAGGPEASKQLESGESEVTMFALAFPDLETDWYRRFDRLYQNIRSERGLKPQSLKLAEAVQIPVEDTASTPVDEPSTTETTTTTLATPPEPPNFALIGGMIAMGAVVGLLFYRVMSKPSRPRRLNPSPDSVVPLAGFSVPAAGPDDVPDFSQLAAAAPSTGSGPATTAPGKKKVVSKQQPGKRPAAGKKGAKKKRVLTPEDAQRYKAAKAAKARAAGEQAPTAKKRRKRPPPPHE